MSKYISNVVNFQEYKDKKNKQLELDREELLQLISSVLKGTVETLQNYGAFVKLENGLSGLVHVSQISQKRVKLPSDVLEVGQEAVSFPSQALL